jgi:N-carbamoyl-L-amino-acid hydrolase
MRDAIAATGLDPAGLGPDPDRLADLDAFIELHVEQGRALADEGVAIGLGTGTWPHGRWRIHLTGMADHAGTARLGDRHDPALVLATSIQAARRAAERHGGVATVGRIQVVPNGSNVIASAVDAWLDVRAAAEQTVQHIVQAVERATRRSARAQRVEVAIERESWTPAITFDPVLRTRLQRAVEAVGIPTRPLATAAGHDAGILAAVLPTAMLFVRNPTGVSHSPAEHATTADCLVGVEALAASLAELALLPDLIAE